MEDKIKQLKKIKNLLDDGLINEIEFDELKKGILGTSYPKESITEKVVENSMGSISIKESVSTTESEKKLTEQVKTINNINENSSINNFLENNIDTTKTNNQVPNKTMLYIYLFIALLVIIGGVIFYSKSFNNSNETNLTIDSTKTDSSKKLNVLYLNDWLKKATGYDFNIENSKISFDISNYGTFDSTFRLDVSGSSENGIKNPILNYYNNYLLIEFENGWKHRIYLTSNLVINSIHYGSHGETNLYNLYNKTSNLVNYEIKNINGNVAEIVSSGHNDSGGYVSKSGKLNLTTGEDKWDNENNQIKESPQSNNPEIEDISKYKTIYQSMMDASVSGDVNKEVDFYSENCSYFGVIRNKAQISAQISKYSIKWKAVEYKVLSFKKVRDSDFEYEIALNVQNNKSHKVITYNITGVLTFDSDDKISNHADYSQKEIK